MTDPTDDLLRQALRAEADHVTADDALLRRLHDAAASDTGTRSRRPLLLVAAAVVAVAGIGAGLALADRSEDESLDVVDQPTPDGSTSTSGCSPVANPPCGDAAARPNLVALLREDGRLVTVDLRTGAEQVLAFRGDPHDADSETGMSSYIDAIDLSADGRWIYYSTCCEPAVGITYRVEVGHPEGDGEPEVVADGADPALSPDGRYLATVTGEAVQVTDLEHPDQSWSSDPVGLPHDVVWSPDGTRLAFVDGHGADGRMRTLRWTGSGLELESGRSQAAFAGWEKGGNPVAVWGTPIADDRSFSQDDSYRWNLWIDQDGAARSTSFDGGGETPVEGLPKALDADW